VPQVVNGTYAPITGDFTGDGRTDVFWYAAGTATDHLWEAAPDGRSFTSRVLQVNGTYRPTAGDLDGDGVDDVFWYGPGTAADYVWYFEPGGQSYTSVPEPAGATTTTRPVMDGCGVHR